jgi:hypothetical protein
LNEFLSSLAGEPLEIKYKHMAEIFQVSQSTLSKLMHNRLNKLPAAMHPDVIVERFTEGVLGSFALSGSTVRNFSQYARLLSERYYLSGSLCECALPLVYSSSIDDEQAKQIYAETLPAFIKKCYEEAYTNTELNYAEGMKIRTEVRSETCFQKICEIINRDEFDSEKLRQLLMIVYAANIRRQITSFIENPSFLDMIERFLRYQMNNPYYNSIHRSEIISISEDSTEIVRQIQEQKQVVLQVKQQQEVVLKQSLHHYLDLSPSEIMTKMFQDFYCTINQMSLIQYINLHEKTNYTTFDQFASAEHVRDEVAGTVMTDLLFRFHLYPDMAGETVTIAYGYKVTAPFIPNISCNYSFSLLYPCRFFEHELVLDAKTRLRWGIQTKLFTPMSNSAYFSQDSKGPYFQSNGGSVDSKRITFYDWAIPGSGYCQSLYELRYAQEERK